MRLGQEGLPWTDWHYCLMSFCGLQHIKANSRNMLNKRVEYKATALYDSNYPELSSSLDLAHFTLLGS